jgi:dynein light chain 1
LQELENVLFYGNPIYDNTKADCRLLVLKRLMTLKNIDGQIINESIIEKARELDGTMNKI